MNLIFDRREYKYYANLNPLSHPGDIMSSLLITYDTFRDDITTLKCIFYNCKNVPDKLPSYIKEEGTISIKDLSEIKIDKDCDHKKFTIKHEPFFEVRNWMGDFYTLQEEITRKISDELIHKKTQLFLQRLADLNLEIDIEQEKHRKFKRFYKERQGNTETIYYNDLTTEGLRIITFKNVVSEFNPDKMSIECKIEYF